MPFKIGLSESHPRPNFTNAPSHINLLMLLLVYLSAQAKFVEPISEGLLFNLKNYYYQIVHDPSSYLQMQKTFPRKRFNNNNTLSFICNSFYLYFYFHLIYFLNHSLRFICSFAPCIQLGTKKSPVGAFFLWRNLPPACPPHNINTYIGIQLDPMQDAHKKHNWQLFGLPVSSFFFFSFFFRWINKCASNPSQGVCKVNT